jgi:hypothetical protein
MLETNYREESAALTQNLIETVFAKIRAKYPHYPATKPVTKSTILATLEAIREPSNAMRLAGRVHEPGTVDDPFNLIPGAVWRAMIDDLRAEIERAA